MKLTIVFILIFIILSFCKISSAITYKLPENGSRLVGQNKIIIVPKGNTKPLEYFAANYQLGLSNMLEANPGTDPYLPKSNKVLNIPHQLILPDTVHEGIIINSAEMRLYYYPKNNNKVIVLPVGIGQIGKNTPMNWTTKIKYKKANPIWIPTAKIRAEYLAKGKILPAVVPSGPDNPMGLYALYIGHLYAIHGTNVDFGIGLRVTHGCIRLRNEDMKLLFNIVPIGTRIQFINEPIKATNEPNGNCYIEVHSPLSTRKDQINNNKVVPIKIKREIIKVFAHSDINYSLLNQAIQNRSGMPVCLN